MMAKRLLPSILILWMMMTSSSIAQNLPLRSDELPPFPAFDPLGSDESLLKAIGKRAELVRVTKKPFLMDQSTAAACDIVVNVDVHGERFCDVFISKESEAAIQKGSDIYAKGTLIVKAKYPDVDRSKTELFTVMRKMEKGYWPEHGDWEYSVVDAEAKHVLARGKIDSCAQCHDGYKKSGFVTRTYLFTKEELEQSRSPFLPGDRP